MLHTFLQALALCGAIVFSIRTVAGILIYLTSFIVAGLTKNSYKFTVGWDQLLPPAIWWATFYFLVNI